MSEREISPLDGRYRERLVELPTYFSDFALMKTRCEVELAYLETLDRTGLFPPLSDAERERIGSARSAFSDADYERIVAIDHEVNHDVKACELFLRERLELADPNRIHFGLTSEDVDNLAYGLLLMRYRDEEQLPLLRRLIDRLAAMADTWSSVVFPARTHGQPASPTTLGKEIAVFLSRLLRQSRQLERHRFRGKLNGATGTHAAAAVAFPGHDWIAFSDAFVESLHLEPNRCTTQIEDHDALAEYFAIVSRILAIVRDLDQDLWQYISRGDLIERPRDAEVGSSTMPHKVNPIRFENGEGNVAIANALLSALSDELTRSRMQRDLSDKTVKRNIGVALAHGHLAIGQTLDGLERIGVDEARLRETVDATPGVLAEAIQTILRGAGVDDPYERLRGLTRGVEVTPERLREFVDELPVSDAVKEQLGALRPSDYIGLATRICEEAVAEARAWLAG
jgi:adenylosuccinate lyase